MMIICNFCRDDCDVDAMHRAGSHRRHMEDCEKVSAHIFPVYKKRGIVFSYCGNKLWLYVTLLILSVLRCAQQREVKILPYTSMLI